MDDYYQKYARPIGKLNVYEIKQNLILWRENLRQELECIIYIKNGLNEDTFNSK
jgi:hypothetical protein